MPAPLVAAKAAKMAYQNMGSISSVSKNGLNFHNKMKGKVAGAAKMPGMSMPSMSMPSMSMSGMSDMLGINPFTLITSLFVVLLVYMTHNLYYWVKIIFSVFFWLLFIGASAYLQMPPKATDFPFYILLVYVFVDYLEMNGKSKGKKKKKKGSSSTNDTEGSSTWWFMPGYSFM